ncbi:hypothetical protein SAMN02745751_02695 [Dethiosulfatibacter aminovorans DSM 17477]|uniref:Uncharacterized protein n=1 Tax=Dethiosulfatibacter aminovorans DSM 17477 TaxID=1121476 RepID=A0A1M6JQL6_9FIRM|nr:hypothetical protein [Dethiosulfatibacter aminovorans]SHJ48970.1 hypothetical protein SAMN02745751_02695 [Dethiosulfatibacter aminovorans DSM 17477]
MKKKYIIMMVSCIILTMMVGCGVKASENENNNDSDTIQNIEEEELSLEEKTREMFAKYYAGIIENKPLDTFECIYNADKLEGIGININESITQMINDSFKRDIINVDMIITGINNIDYGDGSFYSCSVTEKYVNSSNESFSSSQDYIIHIEDDSSIRIVWQGLTGHVVDILNEKSAMRSTSFQIDEFNAYEGVGFISLSINFINNSDVDASLGWVNGYRFVIEDNNNSIISEYRAASSLRCYQTETVTHTIYISDSSLEDFIETLQYVYVTNVYILSDRGLPNPGADPGSVLLYCIGNDHDKFEAKFDDIQ